mgnify:FL=1
MKKILLISCLFIGLSACEQDDTQVTDLPNPTLLFPNLDFRGENYRVSPDLSYIAFYSADPTIRESLLQLYEVATGEITVIGGQIGEGVFWADDSNQFAYVESTVRDGDDFTSRVVVYDAETQQRQNMGSLNLNAIFQIDFLPDGDGLQVIGFEGDLQANREIWRYHYGDEAWTKAAEVQGAFIDGSYQFAPDGEILHIVIALSSGFQGLYTFTIASEESGIRGATKLSHNDIWLSPDGEQMAFINQDGLRSEVWVRDLATEAETLLYVLTRSGDQSRSTLRHLTWTTEGDLVALQNDFDLQSGFVPSLLQIEIR